MGDNSSYKLLYLEIPFKSLTLHFFERITLGCIGTYDQDR